MPATPKARRRRAQILAVAIDRSSAEGLASLSIGGLASAVGMSKSGLFAHFGSKEELQLACVAQAQRHFERGVLQPAADTELGLPRLRALVSAWFDYVEALDYRGGCFFDAASSEFGSRPGAVRDRLALVCGQWREQLAEQARLAIRLGELRSDVDPDTLAFQLHAYSGEANWARELLAEQGAFERARLAAQATLEAAAASPPPALGQAPPRKASAT